MLLVTNIGELGVLQKNKIKNKIEGLVNFGEKNIVTKNFGVKKFRWMSFTEIKSHRNFWHSM